MQNSSKKQKTEFIRLSVTLFAIAGIMALLVALVNNVTKPVIEEIGIQKTESALKAVLPEADGFEALYWSENATVDGVKVGGVWRASNGVGYCVKVSPEGYGGEIETIVGLDNDGAVVDIQIVSMSETSGIGTKITEQSYLDSFKGIKGTVIGDKTSTDSNTVALISGATKSSKAFTKGINAALNVVSQIKGGE